MILENLFETPEREGKIFVRSIKNNNQNAKSHDERIVSLSRDN